MSRALPLVLLIAAGCDPEARCDDPGNICTFFGLSDKDGLPIAGLANEGTCRTEAASYLTLDSTVGPDGQLYVLDWNNHRVVTFDESDDGCDPMRVVTGTSMLGDGPEGDMAVASWNHPTNLVFRDEGTLVMAAWHNSRVVELDLDAGTCDFIAGTGGRAFAGDDGPAETAVLDLPAGIELDADGNLYVADQANQRVRRIDTGGTITTIIGTGEHGYNGDGIPGLEAQLFNELSQAASPAGKLAIDGRQLYIADTGNHRIRVYDLDSGIIDTFAGSGTPGRDGDAGDAVDAQLNAPRDVEVGPDGAVYIADTGNNCVRVVRDGVIGTYAGVCGEAGYDGDRGPATEALLYQPFGVETGPDGTLYIADTDNHVIRTVAPGE